MAPPAPPAGKAGRGALYLAGGNVLFIFAGLIIQFGLPAILPTATFGAYSLISNIASWVNNVTVAGTINTVSKFTAAEPSKARDVQRAALRMQLVLGLGIALVFMAVAPLLAWLLHDRSLTAPLALAGLIVAGYSFYAVFVGTANGLHDFHKQAGLSVLFAFVRAALLLGMAVAGTGVIGVIGGWVAAVVFILILAIVWVGMPTRDGPLGPKLPVAPLVRFFSGVAVYLVLFNLLMFVDAFLLKRLMAEHYAAHAADLQASLVHVVPWAGPASGYHADISKLADVQVAYYAAVQNLARLSYQIVSAATFVVFPLVARSTFEGDPEVTRKYIRITLRYTLVAAAAIAVVMAANPADVLGLVYAPDFVEHGRLALPFLALGNVAFSLIAVTGSILNGAGRARVAILVAGATLVVAIVGNYIALSMAAGGDNVLAVAAAVTGGAMLVGALVCGAILVRQFGAFLPVLSVVRVVVATAVAMAVGQVLPLHGKLMTLVEAAVVVVVFVVVLVATRELGARDLDAIKAVRRKRAPQGETA